MKLTEFIKKYGDAYDHPITLADVSNPEHPLLYVNEEFRKLSGYEDKEVLGRNCRFLQGEKTDKTIVQQMRQHINDNNASVHDLVNYKKNGETFLNRVVLIPFTEESRKYFIGLQHEIEPSQFKDLSKTEPFLLLDRIVNPITVLTTALWDPSKNIDTPEKLKQKYLKPFQDIKNFILNL